jgi:hypothetical protein
MKNDLKNIFTEQVQNLLTEETLTLLEKSIKDKIRLNVESALVEQDNLYADKLEQLIEYQDKIYAKKLSNVVNKFDKNRAKKLRNVIEKANVIVTKEAKQFKNELVTTISDYLETYLDKAIPKEDISQATKNKTAYTVLEGLRHVLGVDSALMKESVKTAIVEGKQMITEAEKTNEKLLQENQALKNGYNKLKAELFLNRKTNNMPEKKREFLFKVLSDKPYKFIEENFDYTATLFDKKERDRLNELKTEAIAQRKVKPDAPIITEQHSNITKQQEEILAATMPYVSELQRIR